MHSAWPGQQLYPDRVPAKRLRTREKHSSGAHTPLRPPPPPFLRYHILLPEVVSISGCHHKETTGRRQAVGDRSDPSANKKG